MNVTVRVSLEVHSENAGRTIGELTIGTVVVSPPAELSLVALLKDTLRVKELLEERLPDAVLLAAITLRVAFEVPWMVVLLETEL